MVSSAHTMRAFLFAKATAATFTFRLAISFLNQLSGSALFSQSG